MSDLVPLIKKSLIVILGPTASGKSDLAVKLAKKFQGEIISADSRQVYKEMDIGTGKVPADKNPKFEIRNSKQIQNLKFQISKQPYFYKGIEHHLIDVASPKRKFTVVQYRKLALKSIDEIFKKGKVPILCGGTGFYIQAVIDGIVIPEVKPNWKLRKELEKKSAKELFQILKKLDPKRAKTIERKNPRRLIRAIEIAKKLGYIPILKKKPLPYPVLMIGIKKEKKKISLLIKKRFFKWLKQGFLKEVLKLKNPSVGRGLSWKRIKDFGIHYKVAVQYLKKEISEQEFIKKSIIELQNYAKRQMTWFKKDKRIKWINNYKKAEKSVKEFLKK